MDRGENVMKTMILLAMTFVLGCDETSHSAEWCTKEQRQRVKKWFELAGAVGFRGSEIDLLHREIAKRGQGDG
jgi:hypothetical protein